MKKFLLIVIAFLPLFGFGQTNLVRWAGTNVGPTPTLIVNNGSISANAVSGSFTTDNYSQPFPGFRGSGYNTSTTAPTDSNYMEFAVKAESGYSIALNDFKFTYARNVDGARKFEVRYSTNLTTWTSLGHTTGVTATPTLKTVSLAGLVVPSNTTFYIRVLPYDRANSSSSGGTFHIKHGTEYSGQPDSSTGPTITGTVSACTPIGDQTLYGNGSWIGYVYANTNGGTPPSDAFTTTYRGYVTQSETFDMNLGTGAISGTNLCGSYTDNFAIRYRMRKNFTAGYYTFTVGGDDGYRLTLNNGSGVVSVLTSWTAQSYGTPQTSATYYLSGNTDLVLEYFENGGSSRLSFSYNECTPAQTGDITGNSPVTCAGSSVTLSATGTGTLQWGIGTVGGVNVLGTGSSIVVTPQVTTTYWVRRSTGCDYSAVKTATVTVTSSGDPSVFGTNLWRVYGYETTDNTSTINLSTAYYRGFYTENNLSFNTATRWAVTSSPSSANSTSGGAWSPSGASCGIDNDTFIFVYKRKGFPCGNYDLSLTNWDDAFEVLIDGVSVRTCSVWFNNGNHGCNGNLGSYILTPETTIEIRVKEQGGESVLAFNAVKTSDLITPTAPVSISGNATVCSGESFTLTATGGTAGTPNIYQWGTGTTVGSNIIANQTGVSLTTTQTANTTYWVRRYNACTASYTDGALLQVAIGTPGDPSVFGTNTWNVYAFASGGNSAPTNYKGYYTQNTLGVQTDAKWNPSLSPSTPLAGSDWQGCAVPVDGFTIIHKRKGFTCSNYQINLLNYDDDTVVIINGVSYNFAGYSYSTTPVGIFGLNENSTIEVRTTDTGGGGSSLHLELIAMTSVYNGSSWNVTNPADTAVQINTSLTVVNDLQVCSCTVKAGQTLTVNPGKTLTVVGNIVVETGGQIIIEDTGSLVQINNDATYTGTPASFTSKRITRPMRRYDFTYWSSPVREQDWSLYNLSPETLLDKYYGYNPATGWVTYLNGNKQMKTGEGYGVRAPQSFGINTQTTFSTKFVGIPNNGIKTITLGGANTYNLIGNPYPSPLDADKFLAENQNTIVGTLYFWTHNTANTNYVYSPGDYAAYNRLGGVGTQPAASGGTTPTKNVATGQAFFVQRLPNANTTVTFNNDMRIGSLVNNQFYKPSPTEIDQTVYKHRLWLNVSNATNAYSEMLVGYITGATNELDAAFDGPTFGGNVISMYSRLNQTNLAIQGRSLPFDENDVIPVGYTTSVAGEYTINMNNFDGVFENQDVFLEDKLNNITTNLKLNNYVFTTAAGTFNNRFEVKFVNSTLGIDTPTVDENAMIVFRNGNQIDIKSKELTIEHVTVYDLLGKVIFDQDNINTQNFSTTQLNASNQVVIVKIITDTKAELVKKIIMN